MGQLFEFVFDLHGQFARRHQDEGARRRDLCRHVFDAVR